MIPNKNLKKKGCIECNLFLFATYNKIYSITNKHIAMTVQEIKEALESGHYVFAGGTQIVFKAHTLIKKNPNVYMALYTEQDHKEALESGNLIILKQNKSLLYNWYLNVFGEPTENDSYYNTWQRRFESGIINFLAEMTQDKAELFGIIAPLQKKHIGL